MSTILSDDDAEIEDLVTCIVCLCKFDEADRKPKFLMCGHTFCRTCLAEIKQNDKISCPLCRKVQVHSGDVMNLPNNNHAVVLLRKKDRNSRESNKISFLDMANETIANMESLLKLKAELDEMKDRRRFNCSEAIKMRKEISTQLSQVLKSIQNFEKEIEEKLEENNGLLAELKVECGEENELNASVNSAREESRGDKTLLELQSMLANIQPTVRHEDTEETIKQRMMVSLANSERQLTLVSAEYNHLRTWKQARLVLQAYDDSSPSDDPIWNTSIKVDWNTSPRSADDSNLLLMSQMIYAFAKPSLAVAVEDSPIVATSPAEGRAAAVNQRIVYRLSRACRDRFRGTGATSRTEMIEPTSLGYNLESSSFSDDNFHGNADSLPEVRRPQSFRLSTARRWRDLLSSDDDN